MRNLRQTFPNTFVGIIRIMLGIIFIMTGTMKLTLADFGAAWSIQLIEADLLRSLPLSSNGAVISAEILYRLKKKHIQFKQIPVTHLPRKYGSPTGNRPTVIFKAGFEAVKLYLDLKFNQSKS